MKFLSISDRHKLFSTPFLTNFQKFINFLTVSSILILEKIFWHPKQKHEKIIAIMI